VRILGELKAKRQDGALAFDRVIIETTGMADPGPVAQTFFMDEGIGEYLLLDSILTVVDAKHGGRQLDEFEEAQEQVGFADRILLSKTDLASAAEVEALRHRLAQINPRAPIRPMHFGATRVDEILDIRGFNLNAILEIDPAFLEDATHDHDDAVHSFVFRAERPLNGARLEEFLSAMIQVHGADMLRYKGVLHLEGNPNRVVFQGVHMLMGGDIGKPWGAGEKRESKLVFIGRNLPEDLFIEGLEQCLVKVQ
jgi:G3E family GTPase